ncbi:hypothetical protein [Microlunatus speluncae]|uniref:hypothetical protein n=1 Tax=Microlunatus speluncae TaxID=2594267 RepID=UPI001266198B|nr:hypothetical protein [Microlunatus speluncae]
MTTDQALPTLLAQALIAYRIELDNEFELRLRRSGFAGFKLPVEFWPLIRPVADERTPIAVLLEQTGRPRRELFPAIGGIERWGYVEVRLDADTQPRRPRQDGYGSGRRLRPGSVLIPTPVGRRARDLWPSVIASMGDRWAERFGPAAMTDLDTSLAMIIESRAESLPDRLAAVLQAFASEVDADSPVPMRIAANFLPALSADPTPIGELPRRTGITGRPVTPALGALTRAGLITSGPVAVGRGKAVTLTPDGLAEQVAFTDRVAAVEGSWRDRYGAAVITSLHDALDALTPKLAEGLQPPEQGWRASREYAAQTRAILDDPRSGLPRHPIGPWLTTS